MPHQKQEETIDALSLEAHTFRSDISELTLKDVEPDILGDPEAVFLQLLPGIQGRMNGLLERAKGSFGITEKNIKEVSKQAELAVEGALRKKISFELAKNELKQFEKGDGAQIVESDQRAREYEQADRMARLMGPIFESKALPFASIESLTIDITARRPAGRRVDEYQIIFKDYQDFLKPLEEEMRGLESEIKELRKPEPRKWWDVMGIGETGYQKRRTERRAKRDKLEDEVLFAAQQKLQKIKEAYENLPRVLSEDFLGSNEEHAKAMMEGKSQVTMTVGDFFRRFKKIATAPPVVYEEPSEIRELRDVRETLKNKVMQANTDFKTAMIDLSLSNGIFALTDSAAESLKKPKFMNLDEL